MVAKSQTYRDPNLGMLPSVLRENAELPELLNVRNSHLELNQISIINVPLLLAMVVLKD